MRRRERSVGEDGCLDLIERAFHLLRCSPLSVPALYYLGAVPFVLGLLFFLTDMLASPFAASRCIGGSLGLGAAYIWMRVWQSLFCLRLGDILMNRVPQRITVNWVFRQVYLHTAYAAWGLLLVPVSVLIMIPFAWVFAWVNNLCIVDLTKNIPGEAASIAFSATMPWPKQNHYLISVLSLFCGFVFFNIVSFLVAFPGLLKSLAGVETQFTQSMHWVASTTFWSMAVALTYLVVDPLVKAVYLSRFYSCESIRSGEDLLAELKRRPVLRGRSLGRLAMLLLFFLTAPPVLAENDVLIVEPSAGVDATALDTSIERVMQRPEFTWRMPRDFAPEQDKAPGFFAGFLDSVFKWMKQTGRTFFKSLRSFLMWLHEKFGSHKFPGKHGTFSPEIFRQLAILLLLVFSGILLGYAIKLFRSRRRPKSIADSAVPLPIDLESESVTASLLEEDEWIALAREMVQAGELRKAVRAWFLAGLALLSREELVVIFQSKSNMEYRRELVRRARRYSDVIPGFTQSISVFERAWYGIRPVTMEEIGQMEQYMEGMRHGLEA